MHQSIQMSEALFQRGKKLLDLRIVAHVALKSLCPRQRRDQIVRLLLQPFILISNSKPSSSIAQALGNSPGNTPLVSNSKNNRTASFHGKHEGSSQNQKLKRIAGWNYKGHNGTKDRYPSGARDKEKEGRYWTCKPNSVTALPPLTI